MESLYTADRHAIDRGVRPILTFNGSPFRFRSVQILLLLGLLTAPLWHLRLIGPYLLTNSDLIPRLVGTKAALEGRDPYSPEVLREIQAAFYGRPLTASDKTDPQGFWYPGHAVLIFAPLAPLSIETARIIFLATTLPLLAYSFWLCVRLTAVRMKGRATIAVVVVALSSWPVVWGLRLEQPTLLVAALIFISCYLIRGGYGASAGLLLAVATIKPQLVLPLIVWLGLWACIHRVWNFVASFGLTTAVLYFCAERIVPGWFFHWRNSVAGYGRSTESAFPLQLILGNFAGWTLTCVLVLWVGLVLWRLRRCSASSPEFVWGVALALAITGCTTLTKLGSIYNQVLLIPACLLVVGANPINYYLGFIRRLTIAMLGWGCFISVWVVAIGETISKPGAIGAAIPFATSLWPPVLLTGCCVAILHEMGIKAFQLPYLAMMRPRGEPHSSLMDH